MRFEFLSKRFMRRRVSRAALALILCALSAALPAFAQRTPQFKIKDFKAPDYFEPPHHTQMRSLVQGAEAEPVAGNRYQIKQLKITVFREDGGIEMRGEAADCLYDASARIATSPAPLQMLTGDEQFRIQGEGFLWMQTNANLTISNRVHTVIRKDLLESSAGTDSVSAVSGGENIDVFSDRFNYDHPSSLATYRNNVRVRGTNLNLTAGTLALELPVAGASLKRIVAEENVAIDYQSAHITGGKAVYSVAEDSVRLTGNPAWRVEERAGRGDELIIDRTNTVFRANGNAHLKLPAAVAGGMGDLLAQGPIEPSAPASTNRFIEVSSDRYELRTNLALFHGAVRVTDLLNSQPQGTLSCGMLTVTLNESNAVQSVLARERVVVEQADTRFTGAEAHFRPAQSTVEFSGNPSWQFGKREGGGDRMTVDRANNGMKVLGNARMKLPSTDLDTASAAEPGTAGPEEQFVEITSDDYEFQGGAGAFRGNVRVNSPQMSLRCDTLSVYSAGPGAPVERIVAEGNVLMDFVEADQQRNRALGNRAVYDLAQNTIELTGKPLVVRDQNTMTGDVIFWNRATDTLVVRNQSIYFQPDGTMTNLFPQPGSKWKK